MISFKMDGIEYRFFDHLFAVSRCGKVLRKMAPYEPRSYRDDGYLSLGRRRLMHRVVATCWLEKPEGSNHVHHINGIRNDNRSSNLEWLTPKEHMRDRHKGTHGKHVRTAAMNEKNRAYRLGKKDSEETCLLKAAVLAINGPKTPCRFSGIEFPSVAAGGRHVGIPPSTFRQRCLSKYFPDYELGPFH